MRAKDFEAIEPGDKILMQVPGNGLMVFEVESIDQDERCVSCKDNIMDFYPNEDDQFTVIERLN